ncbi:MAG: FHA domain-containing protein [Polyangiaceae bacterium]
MGLFSRALELMGVGRAGARERARREEARGNLEEATALWIEADAPEQAVRVLLVRADAALDLERRRLFLGQAAGLASGELSREVERRRARLLLEAAERGAAPPRSELSEQAARLEAVGEPSLAAELHALAGDKESEARALVEAGAIERLEAVLEAEGARERAERQRTSLSARIADLDRSGSRRQALALCRAAEAEDSALAARRRELEQRRALGPRLDLGLEGERLQVVFGDELSVGRSDASVLVASPAVSRTHLVLRRGDAGPVAVDLGSRNGTLLAGVRLAAPIAVGAGLRLELGGEVPWEVLALARDWCAGVRVGSEEVCAPSVHSRPGGFAWRWEPTRLPRALLESGAVRASGSFTVRGSIELLRAIVSDAAPTPPSCSRSCREFLAAPAQARRRRAVDESPRRRCHPRRLGREPEPEPTGTFGGGRWCWRTRRCRRSRLP